MSSLLVSSPPILKPPRSLSFRLKSPSLIPSSSSSSSRGRRHALASSSSIDLHLPVSSALQTPASAMRGAESDVIGLLLRERIVFLGTSVDDFVADAIISQLLLLDAMDPTKDIRLFVNSSGGSLSATMAIYDAVQLARAPQSHLASQHLQHLSSLVVGPSESGLQCPTHG